MVFVENPIDVLDEGLADDVCVGEVTFLKIGRTFHNCSHSAKKGANQVPILTLTFATRR